MRTNASLGLTQLGAAAALLGALLLAPTVALAQDDVTLTMARERFREGVAYFDKRDFAKARVAFLQAYALKKHPAVLLNLAQSELRSGHEADAAKHFAQYLGEHKDATEAERQGAETGLTAAKALVAEVALDVDVVGAEIYVDGDLEGQTPLASPLYLSAGAHQVEARKDGKTASAQVTVAAGQATTVRLKLAAPTKPRPPSSTVTAVPDPVPTPDESEEEPRRGRESFLPWLTSTPGAMIGVGIFGVGLIGGGAFALGSNSAYGAADDIAGDIEAEAVKDGKQSLNGTVTGQGACVSPEAWLRTSTRWGTVAEATRQDRAQQYLDNCDKYTNNVESGDTFKKLTYVSLAVAGAAAIGTVVYYFVDADEAREQGAGRGPRLVVLPMYQPGYAGGLISGTF